MEANFQIFVSKRPFWLRERYIRWFWENLYSSRC